MNRRYRIAWENDDSKLSRNEFRDESLAPTATQAILVDGHGDTVIAPRAWLRTVEPALPESGHVWFRWPDTDWEPGIVMHKGTVIDVNGDKWGPRDLEILPANTIPPDAKVGDPVVNQEMLSTIRSIVEDAGYTDAFLDDAVRALVRDVTTISKDELFRRIDEHGKPAYARRWEDLDRDEQWGVIKWAASQPKGDTREFAKHMYEDIVQSCLYNLRSASEFNPEEVEELLDTYIAVKDTDKPHWKAVAAKAIEIAKRSTS